VGGGGGGGASTRTDCDKPTLAVSEIHFRTRFQYAVSSLLRFGRSSTADM